MNIPQPYYNHYGGMIAFGPDGKLYIGKGDGGWEGDPLDAGQRLDLHLGKMLRIDVDTPDDVPYSVPKDNPFAQADRPQLMSLFGISERDFAKIRIGAKPEIWAYGLRNPYMFHFDKRSGDLFIADVGQNHWEEINWQPASSKGGENYGWRHNQASKCHPTTGPGEKCPIVGVLPVAEYPHEEPWPGAPKLKDGYGCSAQGLGVANYAGFEKAYLIGDWCTGRLWGLAWDNGGNKWQLELCRPSSNSLQAKPTRTAPFWRRTATASTRKTRDRPRTRLARCGVLCRPTRSRAAPRSPRLSRSKARIGRAAFKRLCHFVEWQKAGMSVSRLRPDRTYRRV